MTTIPKRPEVQKKKWHRIVRIPARSSAAAATNSSTSSSTTTKLDQLCWTSASVKTTCSTSRGPQVHACPLKKVQSARRLYQYQPLSKIINCIPMGQPKVPIRRKGEATQKNFSRSSKILN